MKQTRAGFLGQIPILADKLKFDQDIDDEAPLKWARLIAEI